MMLRPKAALLVLFRMGLKEQLLYFDYNSTTPIDPRVLEAMFPYLKENYANPSSSHYFGNLVNEDIKKSRTSVADLIRCEPKEIIFTSGATEAINTALKGITENYTKKGKHLVTVSSEHKAVLDTCKDLERKGFETTYLKVQENGLINISELEKSIRSDTILVSVMYVNNETGVLQPIKEIATIAHTRGAFFMTDATQAVGKISVDVDELGIDLMCFSGHKMYGPKGIGVLYVRQRGNKVSLTPQVHGGGHEQGLRSGTLNVPGIIALEKACEIAQSEMKSNQSTITEMRDYLESELLKLPNTFLNGDSDNRIFNTSNICFKGQDANILIGRMKNVAVSNGSACSSAVVEPSHVLRAMGLSDDEAFASLRFSLGKYNNYNEIDAVLKFIKVFVK
jgi:cysteine desulfurase